MKKPKALILFSGGLDSRITLKIMQEQTTPLAVFFKLPFGAGCGDSDKNIKEFCKQQKIKLKIFNCTKGKLLQEYLNTIRKPKHQRGSAMNPCIDCKSFIFKKAGEYAKRKKINLIASGEVLGQRPMSQMKKSMRVIEEHSNLQSKIIRPLSAKLLPETDAEKKGLIDRNRLFKIEGRQRAEQMQLAKHYKISYPTPSGGCILCEKFLKNRFKQLLSRKLNKKSIKFLSIGRHFLIENSWIIIGRNENENKILEKTKIGKLVNPPFSAPSARYFGKIKKERIIELIKAYSKQSPENKRKEFEQFKL
jgi:tRNA(Ile)-lysidine synthase TilS/MesJ